MTVYKKDLGDGAAGETRQGEKEEKLGEGVLWKRKLEHLFRAGSLRGYQRSRLGLDGSTRGTRKREDDTGRKARASGSPQAFLRRFPISNLFG